MSYDLTTLELDKILAKLSTYAKTNYAKSLIMDLSIPRDYEEIIKLNNQTKEAYLALSKNRDIPLGGLYELNSTIKKAMAQGMCEADELLNIVLMLDCASNVIRYFKELDGLKLEHESLNEILSLIQIPSNLKASITLAISPDGKILDNASRELFMVRRSILSLENRLRAKLNDLTTSRQSMLTDTLVVVRNNRMCLPVKIEYKNTFKGIIHDISSSNTTCYIEPSETIETANQIDSYKALEKKEIFNILKNLSLLVSADADKLLSTLNALTTLDIIFAKANMAFENDYNPVKLNNNQSFKLKKAKHPLLDKTTAVPIDVEIGNKFDAIVITGPNTGGKTVALKTCGLLHLMAYLGMMIPASSESELGYFSEILVDIGDEQSIEQSLSTFSSHMTKMISIINKASFTSLILVDELGSGTDPKEGSSLAIAIIDDLKSRGSKIIVTTHYSELKNYAYNNDRVCNASVEFNANTYKPTYKLLLGVPGKSNAIEIASKLGLDAKIIQSAKDNIESTHTSSSLLMANLEDEIQKMNDEKNHLDEKIKEYDLLLEEIKKEKLELIKSKDKIINNAKNEAKNIISSAKDDALKLIDDIKALKNNEHKEHELADLTHKARSIDIKANDEVLFDQELKVGDYVYVKSYEKYGTITKIKKDKYTVNVGQFAIEFKKNELVLSEAPKKKVVKQTRLSGYNAAGHASLSLDLRGKRYEEVEYLMDQYLDQAMLSNLEQVSIIHGFGTGAVRKAVWEYLKKCSYVKSYRYGGEGEGLNGATIVILK